MSDVEFFGPPTNSTAPLVAPHSRVPTPSEPGPPEPGPAAPASADGQFDDRPGHPEHRPRRLLLRSLSSRLVFGVVSLVVVLVAIIGGGTFYALRSFLLNRLDQQVQSAATQNAGYLFRCINNPDVSNPVTNTGPQLRCFTAGPPPTQHEWVVVLGRDGSPFLEPIGSPNVSALNLTSGERNDLVRNTDQLRTMTLGGVELRVTGRSIQSGFVVVTGLGTDELDRTLGRLFELEIVIGGAAVLLAFVATTWGVRRSLRNLYQVTGTAQDVAAELSPEGRGLDRRVPVMQEGTEVGQLAQSMNTLLAAVEAQFAARLESEQRMRQFLADASHELRTPLTSIRGYAELARMQRAAGGGVDVAGADNLNRIESEGTRMSRLVDDLLLLARGDADHAGSEDSDEPGDLTGVLDEAVSSSRAAYPTRQIQLESGSVPAVLGDREQLLRVLRNLITNAAVHTDPAQPIRVRAGVANGWAVLSVVDGGPGLAPEQAAHVFERFWRADKARTRARGGTGLGLSIVAAVVRAHGGMVHFDSSVDAGSTVTVWLPALPRTSAGA